MNKRITKKIRKRIINDTENVLILLRNEFGERTKNMTSQSIYRNCKKLYLQKKFKV